MKITKSLVLSLFHLAFTTTFLPSSFMASAIHSANDLLEPVYDINGDELRAGAIYFVEVNVLFKPNASTSLEIPTLAFSDISNGTCPNEVVLSTETKFPIKITPVGRSEEIIILEDTYLTVKFDIRYSCRIDISLIWGVEGRKDHPLLTARGHEGLNFITITKYDENEKYIYQLSHCTPLGSKCLLLGFLVKEGVIYVSPDGSPLPIRFRPALPRHETMDVMK